MWKNKVLMFRLILAGFAVFLSACGSVSIVKEEKDSGPDRPMNVSHIPEPVPRVEPRNRAGNTSPYTVLGKTYQLLKKPEGYRQQGVASWYGKKFHGRRTANGEVYNMYGMTAAHKTLPIPSYVRVTNQNNRRSVIVRVNDRGPFHGNRIIDLSYTAAKKLGFEKLGTAKVAVEYIDPTKYHRVTSNLPAQSVSGSEPLAPSPKNPAGYELPAETWLQVGAFSSREGAAKTQSRLKKLTQYPVVILVSRGAGNKKLFKVRVGPLRDNFDLLLLREKVIQAKLPEPHVVSK